MGHCIEKLPHSCGSSDGLQVFEIDGGEYNGYCFSCDTFVRSPYLSDDGTRAIKHKNKLQKTPEEIEESLLEIDSYPIVALPTRRLTSETLNYFNIRVGLSEQDGTTPIFHYYPYYKNEQRVAYKVRLEAEKRMWSIGAMKGANLFGWHQALSTGAKRLYITEGELDAASLYQALRSKSKGTAYEHYHPAVISLTSGAAGAKRNIVDALSSIMSSFKEVVLVFDKDEAGAKAEADVLQILPTATTVTLPGKDPNSCLVDGRSIALCNAVLFGAKKPKNTRLVWGSSLHTSGREQAAYGLSWPWKGLTKLTRGMRFGETYYLGAGVKMGKSELVNAIAAHCIIEHKLKVFLAKPEESNRKTYQMIVGKVAGRIFHDPDREFDFDAYDEASKLVGNNVCLLSLYQHVGWDTLRADIMVAVEEGCKAIFIDPISNLVNGIPSGETNTILQKIAQELAAIAKDLDILIFIFCHLKAPEFGLPHERGGQVFSHQFSGSRAMMRSCNLMLGVEGSKDPELDETERNIRKIVVLEDREFGSSGYIRLYWDKNTGMFNEIEER